jgi:peptide/nickel transport system substrate-binding protein
MKKWSVMLASAGALSFLAAGIGANGTARADSSTPLVEALSQNPDNLTPGMGSLAVDNGPEGLLNAPLIYLDLNDHWQGELARRWTVSKDGLQYTFWMNPKAKWSDGKPLTAQDVVYTWHYYTNPQLHFTYVTGWDKVKSVTAKGDHEVVFTLKEPYAPFLETVASSYIVPQHLFSQWTVDQLNHGYYNSNSISSGPYILQSWTPDQQLVFVPNPNWWGPKVHIQQVIYRIIPDSTTAFNELVNQNLTIGAIPAEQANQVGRLKGNFNIIQPVQATYVQITPVERGFLQDVNVRIALDYATPRDQIVKYILHGMGVVAAADQVPGGYWNNPNVKPRPFDLKKAAAILAKEGFKKGKDGWLYKNGKKLEIPIWTGATKKTFINIAQAVSAQWEKIGVYAPVKTADWSFIFGDKGPQFDGKMEAILFGWGQGVFPDDTIDFNSKYILQNASSPGENAERYSNKLMDQLTEQGTKVTDPVKRREIYWKIQQLEHDTVPLIFLYWVKSQVAVSVHLHGYKQTTFGTTPIWQWSID